MSDMMVDTLYARATDQARKGKLYSTNSLYARARRGGRRRLHLTRRLHRLLDLAEVEAACQVRARWHGGFQTVPIDQIRGSEGRSDDFDGHFHPLQDHNKARWLRIAAARQRGTALPPVELIRVSDVYFVRDGHHRISVARAAGQLDIEAEVTVWQVEGPLPWETCSPVAAGGPLSLTAGLGRLYHRLQAEGARLRQRMSTRLGEALNSVGLWLWARSEPIEVG